MTWCSTREITASCTRNSCKATATRGSRGLSDTTYLPGLSAPTINRLSGMFEEVTRFPSYRLSEMFLPAIGDVFYRLSEMPFTGYRRCLLAATPALARLCSAVNTRARLTKLFFNVLTHRRYPPHPAEQHGNVRITPRGKEVPPPSAGANRASRWTTPKPNK